MMRKVLISIVPLALFYLLGKAAREQQSPEGKPQSSGFDKSQVVEGEIVEEKK